MLILAVHCKLASQGKLPKIKAVIDTINRRNV